MTLDDALGQALRENGLDETYRDEVRALLERPRSEWPPCCGSLCEPCVLALHRAADRARSLASRP